MAEEKVWENPTFPPNHQTRGMAWTLNNPTDEQIEALKTTDCTHIVWGKEIAPSTGTPHLQGMVFWKKKMTIFGALKKFPVKVNNLQHWYKGDFDGVHRTNMNYCTKDLTDVVDIGTPPRQGRRTDVPAVRACVNEFKSMNKVLEMTQGYQCIQIARVMLGIMEPPNRPEIEVYWYYGYEEDAFNQAEEEAKSFEGGWYLCNATNQWWDGYDGQKNVIISDLTKHFGKFHEFLRLVRRRPHRVKVHNGWHPYCATRVWITSEKLPQQIWPSANVVRLAVVLSDEPRHFETPEALRAVATQCQGEFFHKRQICQCFLH